MLSNTLSQGLESYGIGGKLRGLRLGKQMGLVELGRHTGLSSALLSKIERGKLFPTLPTLLRIAMVFGVSLDFFFSRDLKRSTVAIVRKAERSRFPESPDGGPLAYHFESLDFTANDRKLSAFLAEFEALEPKELRTHAHGSAEFLYLISGKLALTVDSEEHLLGAGDSVYFDSTEPHSYRRVGSAKCAAVVVTLP